jgi:hypothetical protein
VEAKTPMAANADSRVIKLITTEISLVDLVTGNLFLNVRVVPEVKNMAMIRVDAIAKVKIDRFSTPMALL